MQVHSTKQASALVVEEDEHIAYLLKFMLEGEGYEVALAQDGRKAKEFIETLPPPHIALLNARLPFVDGFELIGLIRASVTWRSTPILMLLGTTREPEVVRALEAGVTACVQKPFDPGELMSQIHCHAKAPS
jgi:DNA-binding response OmpR family regulator